MSSNKKRLSVFPNGHVFLTLRVETPGNKKEFPNGKHYSFCTERLRDTNPEQALINYVNSYMIGRVHSEKSWT